MQNISGGGGFRGSKRDLSKYVASSVISVGFLMREDGVGAADLPRQEE
jgi:hypothetical protein